MNIILACFPSILDSLFISLQDLDYLQDNQPLYHHLDCAPTEAYLLYRKGIHSNFFHETETLADDYWSSKGRDQVQLVGLRQPKPPRQARHERGQGPRGT